MTTVERCLEQSRGKLTAVEYDKCKDLLLFALKDTVSKYTGLKDQINRTITSYLNDSKIAKELWNWVSINFASNSNGCPGLADVVYVITILKAAKGEEAELRLFYGQERFEQLGRLLGNAHITHKFGVRGETGNAIMKLQDGGRKMKGKTRRMGKGKKNKTYRRKYKKRFT